MALFSSHTNRSGVRVKVARAFDPNATGVISTEDMAKAAAAAGAPGSAAAPAGSSRMRSRKRGKEKADVPVFSRTPQSDQRARSARSRVVEGGGTGQSGAAVPPADEPGEKSGRRAARATTSKGTSATESAAGKVAGAAGAVLGALGSLGRSGKSDGASGSRRGSSERGTNFMRYANDNAVVRAIYDITTGPYRWAFFLVVLIAVVASIYFPVRDYYVAWRSQDVLEERLEQGRSYNEELQDNVDKLLSQEGIEDIARDELGLVREGETAGVVVGLDEDGNPIPKEDSSDKDDSGEDGEKDGGSDADEDGSGADDAEDLDGDGVPDDEQTPTTVDGKAAGGTGSSKKGVPDTLAEKTGNTEIETPWYLSVLDSVFFFSPDEAQGIMSVGASEQ